jgi:hypothetical protein
MKYSLDNLNSYQICLSSSALSIYVLPLMQESKFHTHTNQKEN